MPGRLRETERILPMPDDDGAYPHSVPNWDVAWAMAGALVRLVAVITAGVFVASLSGTVHAGRVGGPGVGERPHHPDQIRERHGRMDAKARPDDCAALYDALPGARGDDLVDLLQAAPFDCIVFLERHGSAALQFAVATEANVLDVARAIPDIVRDYDGTYESVRLRNLLRFLLVVQDIHRWCVQGSRSGACADGIWDAAEPWSIAPGSDVHEAILRAVAAIRDNAHFSDTSGEHGETLLDMGFLIRDYGYSADHLDIVVWWLDRWDTRYTEAQFRLFFQVLFDILQTGTSVDGILHNLTALFCTDLGDSIRL